jgi:hypothetical protein
MPRIDIVATDQDPKYVTQVGLSIFKMWRDFAAGRQSLGGRSLMHPTGRYAASIRMGRWVRGQEMSRRGRGGRRMVSRIAIIADEGIAPEAGFIERGHHRIDMLRYLQLGRFYPMHRLGGGYATDAASTYYPSALHSQSFVGGRRQAQRMWAIGREISKAGGAKTPPRIFGRGGRGRSNTSNTGPAWTIPPMVAYSPTQHLVDLFRQQYGDLEYTAS